MKTIHIKDLAGTFAENKDIARDLRVNKIIPAIKKNEKIILDFNGVTGATQSFIHALISDAFRQFNDTALDYMEFKNRSPVVKEIISIVADYMQES